MKNKFGTIVFSIITIILLACMTILGINIYQDFIESQKVEVGSYEYVPDNKETVQNIEEKSETYTNIGDILSSPNSSGIYDSNSNNGYFYSQLNEISKAMYDGLINNMENLETGTYKIEYGSKFSSVLSQDNGQALLQEYYQSAIEAFTYDNPEVFYLNITKMSINIETTTKGKKVTYNVYIDNGNEENYLADGFSSKIQVEQCKNQIENVKNTLLNTLSGSDYQKILTIHNYLVDNISYDMTISKSNIYNLYGALDNKECVCEGYAKAFKYLAAEAGINCVMVIGEATDSDGKSEGHAWDYVKIADKWYVIDTTWDDPVITGGGMLTNELRYKYFLKGSDTINKDHNSIGQFTTNGKIFNYPTLSIEDY